jgi:hypothetical protein
LHIPHNAAIRSAKLLIYPTEVSGSLQAVIRGVAEDDPATWSSSNIPSQRPLTDAAIPANAADWTNLRVGAWASIDITTIVQEIVHRSGWQYSNAMSVTIDTTGGDVDIIGITAYDSAPTSSAKIEIDYEVTLDDGLMLYLPFNDGSGTSARDDSGKGNTGALQNMNDSNWVSGKSGDALDFNGSDEYVLCTHSSSLNILTAISISAWIKLDSVSGWQSICAKVGTNDATSAIYLSAEDTKLWFILYHDGGYSNITSTGGLSAGVWHHVVARYDGSDMELFLDTVSIGSTTASFVINPIGDDMWIGANSRWGEYLSGQVDELRVYDRALIKSEITWLYNHPPGTMEDTPSGRVCFTDLDGTGHTISDMIALDVGTELTDSTDTFSISLLNTADRYAWLTRGCVVEVLIGMDGVNDLKLSGYVSDVSKTMDGTGSLPLMDVVGEDGGVRLNHIFFSGRFYDQEVSALLIAAIDTIDFTTGDSYRELAGIDASNAYIESTSYSIDEASYVWKSLSAAIKELADLVGYDWYVDPDSKLHFFDPAGVATTATIVDGDLDGAPTISDIGAVVNRAIVIGGYHQVEDKHGSGYDHTVALAATPPRTQLFVPTEDYLGSVLIYTKLVSGTPDLDLSIQGESGGSADGINLSNGQLTVKNTSIIDGGYTEFRFDNQVTLTPGVNYYLVLSPTSAGINVGVDSGGTVLDYSTRYPARVSVMSNDDTSQEQYGIYTDVHRDDKIEDPQVAEILAGEMLMTYSKQTASLTVLGDDLKAGDNVLLTISEPGIAINKVMKIQSSSMNVGVKFIYNQLEMEEV